MQSPVSMHRGMAGGQSLSGLPRQDNIQVAAVGILSRRLLSVPGLPEQKGHHGVSTFLYVFKT